MRFLTWLQQAGYKTKVNSGVPTEQWSNPMLQKAVRRAWAWRSPVVVVPPVDAPRPLYVAPRPWIPSHYDQYGPFVPGHWR
jgi:hypothetical protein